MTKTETEDQCEDCNNMDERKTLQRIVTLRKADLTAAHVVTRTASRAASRAVDSVAGGSDVGVVWDSIHGFAVVAKAAADTWSATWNVAVARADLAAFDAKNPATIDHPKGR